MILREQLVEFSMLRAVKEGLELPEYGFVIAPASGATVLVREAFPTPDERSEPLEITTVAFGFSVDDGGVPMELGSNLTKYRHTFTVWVFGTSMEFAKQVASSIKHILRTNDDLVPLYDFNQEGDPQIDALLIDRVQTEHQGNSSPRPWDQYVYTTSAVAEDTYYP